MIEDEDEDEGERLIRLTSLYLSPIHFFADFLLDISPKMMARTRRKMTDDEDEDELPFGRVEEQLLKVLLADQRDRFALVLGREGKEAGVGHEGGVLNVDGNLGRGSEVREGQQ